MAFSLIARFSRISTVGLPAGSPRRINLSRKHTAFQVKKCSEISTDSLSFLNVEKEDGFCVVEMRRKPVNSLNLEILTELGHVIDELESGKDCQGLILTSALPRIFSAGLDITEMVQPKDERLKKFWNSFQDIWLKLYGSRLATVAAINGASPAGGCLLAVSCDYRIMADGFVIGPNETQLGIVAPPWFKDTLFNTVGHRKTELLLSLGQLVSSKEALDIGLVDRVVLPDDVLSNAKSEVKKWLAIPARARYATKMMMRTPILDKLWTGRAEDTKAFQEFVCKESTQKLIMEYLKKLAEKSKK